MRCSARYLPTASRHQMSSTQSVVISDALLGAVPVDRLAAGSPIREAIRRHQWSSPVDRLAAGSPIREVVDDDEPTCQERRVERQSVGIRRDPRNQTSSVVLTWREPRVEHAERLVIRRNQTQSDAIRRNQSSPGESRG